MEDRMPAVKNAPNTAPVRTMLTVSEVCEHFDIAQSTLYCMIARCEFPRPDRIGRRLVRWNAAKLNQWIDAGCTSKPLKGKI
jgi:predicted DNA-binding transcriptional regulator AlpA